MTRWAISDERGLVFIDKIYGVDNKKLEDHGLLTYFVYDGETAVLNERTLNRFFN